MAARRRPIVYEDTEIQKSGDTFACDHCWKLKRAYDYSIICTHDAMRIQPRYHLDCYAKCSNWIDFHIPCSPEELEGFDALKKRKGKNDKLNKFCKLLWPNQVEPEMRPKLNLSQPIDEMTKQELRIELERRAIKQHVEDKSWDHERDESLIMDEVQGRLKEYLCNDECQNMNNLLVIGYCTKTEKENTMNIPQYLKKMVLKYYPPFLLTNN